MMLWLSYLAPYPWHGSRTNTESGSGMDFEIGLGKFQKLGYEEDGGEVEGVEEKEKAMT